MSSFVHHLHPDSVAILNFGAVIYDEFSCSKNIKTQPGKIIPNKKDEEKFTNFLYAAEI